MIFGSINKCFGVAIVLANEAIKVGQALQAKGIPISTIYNWWRPEPRNANLGGAAGRHRYGISVDVRFANRAEQKKAFSELCKMRAAGKLRAVGYYSRTGLHLGVGDRTAKTWGRSCGSAPMFPVAVR